MKIEFVEYSTVFLEKSWTWLNDSEIKYLTNTSHFSKEGQWEWYLSLKNKTDYKIWGITADEWPIGVVGLKNITRLSAEYWGYIGEKEYWGKKIGVSMVEKMIEFAKLNGLEFITLKVIEDNIRAIKLYEKMGFVELSREIDGFVLMQLNFK